MQGAAWGYSWDLLIEQQVFFMRHQGWHLPQGCLRASPELWGLEHSLVTVGHRCSCLKVHTQLRAPCHAAREVVTQMDDSSIQARP